MKKITRWLAHAGFAVSLVSAAAAEARDFRSAEVHPPDYPTTMAVAHMGKVLSERTGGKMGVKVYPNGALGSEKDNIEQLRLGALDMMRINVAPLNSVVPETIVTGLPFVFRSTEHMRKVLDGPIGDDILASMESQGLVGLAFYDSGARSFYSKKPIRAVADLKGMKIRVIQSDLFVAMVEALGANPTPMPYGEVYTALKTGIVDAAENNWPSYESSRHFEAAKESVPYMRQLWDEREVKSRKAVEAAGSQVITVANKKEFVDAMKPVYAKFANTPRLSGLVKRIQDTP